MSLLIQPLRDAIEHNTASRDAFLPTLTPVQWNLLEGYLQPCDLAAGEVLFEQQAPDRSVFLVESGSLSVHLLDRQGEVRLSMLGRGAVLGEGAFFSRAPRAATAGASVPTRVWRLPAVRFSEMSNRQPELALELAMALGAVLARRMQHRALRHAVT